MARNSCTFALLTIALLAACGGDDGIPNASIPNFVDTLTLASLNGGALQAPSAYSVTTNSAVRTYETINFEFAYTYDAVGARHLFLPLAVLGLSPGNALRPGLIKTDKEFDQVTKAAQNGYITSDTVQVDSGDVYMVRTTTICSSLGVPQYAKVQIIALDLAAHTLTIQALANNNCGYRGLKVGLPKE